jgi:hypothetical protein
LSERPFTRFIVAVTTPSLKGIKVSVKIAIFIKFLNKK